MTSLSFPTLHKNRSHGSVASVAADAGHLQLTAAMRSMWLQEQLDPSGVVNHLGHTGRIVESVDASLLHDALQEIVDAREVLRYTLTVDDGEPYFVQHDHVDVVLHQVSGEGWSRSQFEEFVTRWTYGKYDLERGPLFRFALVDHGTDEYSFVVAMHHLIGDMWSLTILMSEMAEAYQRRAGRDASPLRPDRFALRQQLEAERAYLDSESAEIDLAYWRTQLSDLGDPVLIPTDFPRGPHVGHRGGILTRVLDPKRTTQVRQFAKAHGTTPFATMLAIFHVLLFRYTGRPDIDVTTTRASRSIRSARSFGCYVDGIVLRTRGDGAMSFSELLARVDETVRQGFDHGSMPNQEVIERALGSRSGRSHGPSPLGFVWQKTTRVLPRDISEATAIGRAGIRGRLGGWEIETDFVSHRTSPREISLLVAELGDEFGVSLEFMRDLLDESTAAQMLRHFDVLLDAAIDEPSVPISHLTIMDDEEVAAIVAADTRSTSPGDNTVFEPLHRRVASVAEASPDDVAVRCGSDALTYGELAQRVSGVAHAVRDTGVRPGALVGLLIERSVDMIVAVLGILEAGAAYVPLDPALPAARTDAMLSDASIQTVVTTTESAEHFRELLAQRQVLLLDDVDVAGGAVPLGIDRVADDLAYVIFTSGSTGRAKGVQVDHGNLAHIVDAMVSEPGFGPDDVVMAVVNLAFDVSVVDIFATLSVGAQLVIADRDIRVDGRRLGDAIDRHGITLMQATPTTWSMLVEAGWKGSPDLRVLSGGEPLPTGLADRLAERSGELWNLYGPTEITVYAAGKRILDADRPVPIGGPIDNTTLYVLDEHQQLVPNGVTGELYVAGNGVTRGYLDQPELTNAAFTDDPLRPHDRPHQRRYRTGDLVKRDHTGTYYHLGRTDNQIKLRGYRIELGEIEATLNTHPQINHTVVTTFTPTNDDTDTRIVAYVTTNDTNLTTDAIRTHAAASLPSHMIPSAIVQLDHFPLTANNKIDRTRLPRPGTTRRETADDPPRPGLERHIAAVWQDILDTENIGRHDDFFQLGGHSLLAVKAFARLEPVNPHEVPISVLFRAPTVATLAIALGDARFSQRFTSLVEVNATGTRPRFFYVSPFMINVLTFSHLGHCLGPDQPFYCLQPQGIEHDDTIHDSVEEMARHYLAEIRQVQPVGPYFIGGHCSGSMVAFEMARQLQDSGESTQLLLLVDSRPPRTTATAGTRSTDRFRLGRLGATLGHVRVVLRRLVHHARTHRLVGSLRYSTKWFTRILIDQVWLRGFGNPRSQRAAKARFVHYKAHSRYQGSRIAGDATLIRCEDWASRSDKDWHLQWAELIDGTLHVRTTKGSHDGLTDKANGGLEELAQNIAASITASIDAQRRGQKPAPDFDTMLDSKPDDR